MANMIGEAIAREEDRFEAEHPVDIRLPMRLEPRCRDDDFSRGLEARSADPLWFLTRQWQVGEFKGEDTGSPIRVDVTTKTQRVDKVQLGPGIRDVTLSEDSPPLEMLVEQEYIKLDWRTRVQIGQHLERLLYAALGINARRVICHLRKQYSVNQPTEDERSIMDRATQRFKSVMAGRAIEGGTLIQAINCTQDGEIELPSTMDSWLGDDIEGVRRAIGKLLEWFESLYGSLNALEPSESVAWARSDLEYTFRVEAPAGSNEKTTLVAPNYRNGDLDWYTFAVASDSGASDVAVNEPMHFVPTRVGFAGMPHARWWAFEDRQTDFGNLDTVTTDLAKIMIMDFAMLYGDDWFIVPLSVDVGTITRIHSLKVLDVFGVVTDIEPARSVSEHPWESWQMYGLSLESNPDEVGEFLFLPPTVSFREESPPFEEVRFIRDEMANMVWAIEHSVLNGLGQPIVGFDAQTERRARQREADLKADLEALESLRQQLHDAMAELESANTIGGVTPEALQTQVRELEERIADIQARLAASGIASNSESTKAVETGLPCYRLATTVPDNWIPYIPVRESSTNPSVYLRRAAMLTNEEDEQPTVIMPMTQLISGSNGTNPLDRIHEEAVTRAGQKVQMTWQRVRWMDGKTYVWVGRKIVLGKGEGNSGLEYDVLDPTKSKGGY